MGQKYLSHLLRAPLLFTLLIVALITNTVSAQTPSAAQIEQFKRLPPAQQRALAKSFGVDIEQLEALTKSSDSADPNPVPSEEISGVRAAGQQ